MFAVIIQSKSKKFLSALLALIAGIFVASYIRVPFVSIYAVALCAGVAIILVRHARVRIISMWILCGMLGMTRLLLATPDLASPNHIASYNNQNVVVVGVIAQEPDIRLDHQKLTMATRSVSVNSGRDLPRQIRNVHGAILLKTSLYPGYGYGDLIQLTCMIEKPEHIEDFAYDKYLARYDIYSVCWRGQITLLDTAKGNVIMASILSAKSRFMDALSRSISEPYASFLAGLLVGARRGIPQYLLDAFNTTGTTHIIAISGSNITIIAAVVIGCMEFLTIARRRAFWLTSGMIAVFVIMTGASASVVRAGIMGILVLLARQLGRASRATNALVCTACVMLMVNPKILVYDAGFQLSFLATMGLIYLYPILQKHTAWIPSCGGMKDALVTTLSAMITTTPLIVYQFGRFSIVAPIANVLILPVIPITMAIGFVAGMVGMLSAPVGSVIGWGAWVLLEYMIRVAEWLSGFTYAAVTI